MERSLTDEEINELQVGFYVLYFFSPFLLVQLILYSFKLLTSITVNAVECEGPGGEEVKCCSKMRVSGRVLPSVCRILN